MSLNHDYAVQLLSEQKVRDFHAEVARDRLVREAVAARGTSARQPWWRRWSAPAPAALGSPANGLRRSQPDRLRPRNATHPVAP